MWNDRLNIANYTGVTDIISDFDSWPIAIFDSFLILAHSCTDAYECASMRKLSKIAIGHESKSLKISVTPV